MDIPFIRYSLDELPFVIVTLVIAFTIHEFAHAYTAYKFGDPTAARQGRLTLSPISHLDPIGTLMLLIAGFGWARPVPVNRFNFKRPHLAGIVVSAMGPISNLLLAIIGFLIFYILMTMGIITSPTDGMKNQILYSFFNYFIYINIALFVFNLLPFPPLDGYRILEDLAPNHLRAKMTQFESYGAILFLIVVLTPLSHYTIQPIFNTVIPGIINVLYTFFSKIF